MGKKMRKYFGKYRYQSLNLLKEVLFFIISLVVYFPLHIKKIISCFIFSEDYKAKNVHSLLEKEVFLMIVLLILTQLYHLNMKREMIVAVPFLRVICHSLGIKV